MCFTGKLTKTRQKTDELSVRKEESDENNQVYLSEPK